MPITITVPGASATQIGPGYEIQVDSDLIGPIGFDWTFRVGYAVDTDFVNEAFVETAVAAGNHGIGWRVQSQTGATLQLNPLDLVNGQTVHVRAQLLNGSTVEDSGTLNMVWDGSSQLGTIVTTLPRSVSGQFLSTDRAKLTETDTLAVNGLQAAVPRATGGPVEISLPNLLSWIPHAILGNHFDPFTIEGDGSTEIPTLLGAQIVWGVELQVDSYPPNFSTIDGFVVRAHQRFAQLVLITQPPFFGHALFPDFLNLHEVTRSWIWQYPFPLSVGWSAPPGVSITARWISAIQAP
jgi:hypothetical protein